MGGEREKGCRWVMQERERGCEMGVGNVKFVEVAHGDEHVLSDYNFVERCK